MPEVAVAASKWLLLVHQLPPRPSNLRVHIWRRLQRVGAVALRSSVYVLPNTSEAREDFDWIRAEITGRGGQVSLLAAAAVDGYTDDELEAGFRNARTADYQALVRDVEALRKSHSSKTHRPSRASVQRALAKVRERYQQLKGTDFFGATGAAEAQSVIEQLELLQQPRRTEGEASAQVDRRFFRRRVWITRPRPGIDRMASAWLIRRFIASDAKFAFGAAAEPDQIAFDMTDVEFGHHGTDCTYETLLRRFAIADPAAVRIGQLVHDLDLKESRYALADAPTIGRLVEGLRESGTSDQAILDSGMAMIEALYRSFTADTQVKVARPRRPAGRRTMAGRHSTARRR